MNGAKNGKAVRTFVTAEYEGFSEEELDILEVIDKETAEELKREWNNVDAGDIVEAVEEMLKGFKERKL